MVLAELDERRYEYKGRRYLRRPEPLTFPSSGPLLDEEGNLVPETGRHVMIRTALFLAVRHAFRGRALVTSDQFVYWAATNPRQCVCPDLAVRVGAPWELVDVWRTWQFGAPHAAVEVVSDHDRRGRERALKLERYRRAGVAEVVLFDAADTEAPIRIFDGIDGDLVERDLSHPDALRSESLGFFWAVHQDAACGPMLRPALDRDGRHLLPTPEEAERTARESERRAMETEREAKEAEREAKEAERQAKEAEREAKEAERQAKEAALARVRELEAELARRG